MQAFSICISDLHYIRGMKFTKFFMNVVACSLQQARPVSVPIPGSWSLIPAFPFQCLKMPACFGPEFDQKGQPSVACICM